MRSELFPVLNTRCIFSKLYVSRGNKHSIKTILCGHSTSVATFAFWISSKSESEAHRDRAAFLRVEGVRPEFQVFYGITLGR